VTDKIKLGAKYDSNGTRIIYDVNTGAELENVINFEIGCDARAIDTLTLTVYLVGDNGKITPVHGGK
jgi:hypothetical protein